MALDALIVAILPNHGITDFASFEDFDDAAYTGPIKKLMESRMPYALV